MMTNTTNKKWISAAIPPTKDGDYMVKFYFPHRHPTDRIEIAWRSFKNGIWSNSKHFDTTEEHWLDSWCNEE